MELPRRRGGTYEHRTFVANILAPTTGTAGAADLRTTPSTRGASPSPSSRPPWATELDAPAAQEQAPSGPGRPPSTSRQRSTVPAAAPHGPQDFSFHVPSPSLIAAQPRRPESEPEPRVSAASWDDGVTGPGPGRWPGQAPSQAPQRGRPSSAGRPPRAPPDSPSSGARWGGPAADQLDLWAHEQQQHLHLPQHNFDPDHGLPEHPQQRPQHSHGQKGGPPHSSNFADGGRHRDGDLYARIDHRDEPPSPPPAAAAAGRRAAAATAATAAPSSRSTPATHSGAAGGGRLPSGDLSAADAASRGGGGGGGGRTAAVGSVSSRTGAVAGAASRAAPTPGRLGAASPARAAAAARGAERDGADCGRAAPPPRSSSNPKPRPTAPPKRSSSITGNVRRPEWAGLGDAEPAAPRPRRTAGTAGGGGSAGTGGGAGRWDADPDGGSGDRGSWLFAGEADDKSATAAAGPGKGDATGSRGQPSPQQLHSQRQGKEGGTRPFQAQIRGGAEVVAHREWAAADPPAHASDGGDDGADGAQDGGNGGGRSGGSGASVSRAADALEATFTSPKPRAASPVHRPARAPVAPEVGLGGGGGGGLSLGHGAMSGGGGGAGGARQGTAAAAESARQVQALQEENARLRDELEHLRRLLTATGGDGGRIGAAATAEAAGGGGGRRSVAAATAAAARPWSAASSVGGGGGGGGGADAAAAGTSLAVAAAAGVTLQQYKSQVIQLQRQVALMSVEIEAKSRLALEAEGVLLETASRLEELADCCAPSRDRAAPGAVDGGGAEDAPTLNRQQLSQLHKWSRQMLGRLRSEKSQASKLFTRDAQERRSGGFGGGGGGGGGFGRPRTPLDGNGFGGGGGGDGDAGPAWVVPFIPAGGNAFLLGAAAAAGDGGDDDLAAAAPKARQPPPAAAAPAAPSVAGIACGRAVLLADPVRAHRLELQLGALAPRLAGLAVLVRSALLPAMPWLGLEAADRLQADVGEAAEGVAQAAEGLVSLCALLPAGAAAFGDAPVAAEPRRRAAEVEAGRDSWLYSSPELTAAKPQEPEENLQEDASAGAGGGGGIVDVSRLQASIAPLLRDRKSGGRALADLLGQLRARAQAASAKRAVLERELRFSCRASALHSEHVSHLMMSVGMALRECRGAKDAAAIKSYFAAAAAVRQVLEAADSLEIHPCEACLKALVDVIRAQRPQLDCLPELLLKAPAADVEGQLLAKVEDLHQGFRKALARLDAHKRRQLGGAGGGGDGGGGGKGRGAAAGGEGSDAYASSEDDGGSDMEEAGGGGGGSGTRSQALPLSQAGPGVGSGSGSRAGGGVAAASGLGSSAPQRAGKPPKPRPEWQE